MVCSTFLTTGVTGVIVSRDAVGIASRYIVPLADAYTDTWKASDGDIVTIGFRYFANPVTGRRYINCEALVGAAILQKDKIILLK